MMILKNIKLKESKILNESFIQPVKELTDPLPQQVKDILSNGSSKPIDWEHPEEIFKQDMSVSNDAWTAAKDVAGAYANNIVKLFVQCCVVGRLITKEQAEDMGDSLVHIINDMGFKEQENPMLVFLKLIKGQINLTNGELIMLNNLWADNVLSGSDFNGQGKDKLESIIFNPNLYSMDTNLTTDMESIIRAYKELSDTYNINDLNLDAIAQTKGFPETYASLRNEMKTSNKTLVRNIIIFENPSNPKGKINKYYWIEKAIQVGKDSEEEEDSNSKSGIEKVKKAMKSLKKDSLLDTIAQLRKDGTLSQEDMDMIDHLFKTGN